VTVYCKISECVFNQELDKPHQRIYGRNYTPIGNMGQYSGTCGLGVLRVRTNTVHTSQTKHVIPECASFSEDETLLTVMATEPVVSFCDEKRCLHFGKGEGCTLPDDVYVAWQEVNFLGEVSRYPKCDSFSNRGISGHMDFSKSFQR